MVVPFKQARPGPSSSVSLEAEPLPVQPIDILLAEDDPTNQFAMLRILETMGHRVSLAKDGQQVIDLYKDGDFDCILMDIQMPVMDGVEAAKIIKKTELGKKNKIPIIALTACTMSGDRERFLEAGMDDYISKPVSLEDFHRVFNKFFGQK